MAKNLSLGNFLTTSRSNISKSQTFFEKQVSLKLKVTFSTNFRPKIKNIVAAVFEKNIKVSDFGLIWRSFREYLQVKNYFQKSGSVTFLPLYSPNRKIIRAVSEKTALPTNKLLPTTPILQNLTDAGPKKFKSLQVFHCFHRLLTKLLLPRLQNLQQQIVLSFQIDQQK